MASPDRQNQPKIHRTTQDIANSSFDETFQVSAIELLAYNAASNTLDRVQIDESGFIVVTVGPAVVIDAINTPVATIGSISSGNPDDDTAPVKIGGVATGSVPTAVTEGSRVTASFDLRGRLRTHNDSSLVSSVTSVNDSASNQTLLSSNTDRVEAKFYNDSSSTLYIKEGATASSSSYTVKLYTDDFYTTSHIGRIDGIWSSDSTGSVKITELT